MLFYNSFSSKRLNGNTFLELKIIQFINGKFKKAKNKKHTREKRKSVFEQHSTTTTTTTTTAMMIMMMMIMMV